MVTIDGGFVVLAGGFFDVGFVGGVISSDILVT